MDEKTRSERRAEQNEQQAKKPLTEKQIRVRIATSSEQSPVALAFKAAAQR